MKNDKRSNRPAPSTRNAPEYTTRQREKIRQGLRILAKVIVRAQLRRQAAGCGPTPDESAGEKKLPEPGGQN
jgi:hypothetical protein